jgi:beta-glucosidase-like glycosyl hydrolase
LTRCARRTRRGRARRRGAPHAAIAFRAAETPKGTAFDVDANHALARKIAGEGMVLLKNDGILPLQNPRNMAVIGRAAKHPHFQGGGSSHINPTQVDSPFEELQSWPAAPRSPTARATRPATISNRR